MRVDAASAAVGLHDDRPKPLEHHRRLFDTQGTDWHGNACGGESLRERMLVARGTDCGACRAEVDDAGLFDTFEERGQKIIRLRGDDEGCVDGGERRIERLEGLRGRHCIDRDDATRKPDGHSGVEHDGDISAGGMEVLHESTQHAAALGQKCRVERLAGETPATEVFVDQTPHGVPSETV